MTLLDTLIKAIPPSLISDAASKLGESESGISKALNGFLPTILSGMAGKANDEGALGNLFSMLNNNENVGFLDDLGGLIGGGNLAKGDPRDVAGNLMGQLFGDKVGPIIGAIASFAGLKSKGSSSSILGVAGPLIMGVLSRKITKDGLNINGLRSLLLGEKDKYAAAVPMEVAPLLGLKAVAPAAAADMEEKSGVMGWLLPLLGLIGLGLIAWMCTRGTEDSVKVEKAETVVVNENIDRTVPVTADESAVEVEAPAVDVTEVEPATSSDEMAFAKRIGEFDLVGNADGVEAKLIEFIESDRAPCTEAACWFTFDRLTFQTSSAELDMVKSGAQIENIHRILEAYPNIQLKFGGYTDNTGSEAFNMTLSQQRADAVVAAVAALGTDVSRMGAEGYGPQFPVATNDTAEGRAKNRRIDVRVRGR